jgi:hypothetical protein
MVRRWLGGPATRTGRGSSWAKTRRRGRAFAEILRSVTVGHEGRAYTMAYFTSEAAAREGERKEPPPELQVQMEEMAALSVGEPEFLVVRMLVEFGQADLGPMIVAEPVAN